MKKKLFYTFIFAGIVAQFVVLAFNIVLHETILRKGEVCRFQTAPFDPFDAFRGQYVQLHFNVFEKERSYFLSDAPLPGKWHYLQIETDSFGFSVIQRTSPKCDLPSPYVKVLVKYCYPYYISVKDADGKSKSVDTGQYKVYCHLPFTRYYMPERLAPEAEKAYRTRRRGSDMPPAVAVVRVWKGRAVMEDLEIDGVPVRAYLEGKRKEG